MTKVMAKAKSILFDLDGTLVDTAPDLTAALNKVLSAHARPELPVMRARPYVSRGAMGLLYCGFGIDPSSPEYPAYVEEFLGYYRQDLCVDSCLFDGMNSVLDTLDDRQFRWGVVTNKAANLTEPLLKELHLIDRLHVLVSGDTTPSRKPSPEPLLHACKMGKLLPHETLYVGDDPRDIEAALAAGMPSIAVRYGYYDQSEDIDAWGANAVIDHPSQLIDYLEV